LQKQEYEYILEHLEINAITIVGGIIY